MKLRNIFFLMAFALPLLFISCEDEDDEIIDDDPLDDLIIDSELCRVQKVINANLKNVFTYQYMPDYPELLDFYYEYDPLSGQVKESHKFIYGPASGGRVRVDSSFYYIGDLYMYSPGQFVNMNVYYYTDYGDNFDKLDSVEVFFYTGFEAEPFGHKGTIYYEFGDDDLLETEFYLDRVDTDAGTLRDNYVIEYTYDTKGRLTEWNYYNFEDRLTYYEKYELTDYLKPNYKFTVMPQLAWANRFAPSKLTLPRYVGGSISGSSTYNYRYQVNNKKYIVEKVVIYSPGVEEVLELLTYECREE